MLASASDYHTFHKFTPGGRNQAAQTYLEAVQTALDAGIRPRLHLEDATRAPMDFMRPFVEAVHGDGARATARSCAPSSASATRWDSACPTTTSRCRAASRA